MKIKSVLSSVVLGTVMLTLSACDSGGPSVDVEEVIQSGISESIKNYEIEPIDLDLSGIEQSTRELEQLNAELEQSNKEFEQNMNEINAEFKQSMSELNL
ncbi:hypothetical protein N9089_01990 [Crocinitomicaceae bacterium]|nr:hypothetical protein [Crocinitomicaceae bacterium]